MPGAGREIAPHGMGQGDDRWQDGLIAKASRLVDRFLDRKPSRNKTMVQRLRIKFVLLGTSAILVDLSPILGIAEMTLYS